MELSFGLYTLEEVFRKLGDKKEYSFSEFFSKMSEDLSKNESNTLEGILRENIKILQSETYLAKREEDELKSLILSLGKSDIYSQERIINLTVENLKKLTDRTQEDINTKGLVYRKVTTIVGLVVGIILV
jgi:stage III sporulation protein AB